MGKFGLKFAVYTVSVYAALFSVSALSSVKSEKPLLEDFGPATELVSNEGKSAFVGRAYDPLTGDLLYIERYQVTFDERGAHRNSLVEYINPDGTPFAVKQVRYDGVATAPSITFKDYRDNNEIRVESGLSRTTVAIRENGETNVSLIAAPVDMSMVIDAGFDQFLQQNWDRLQNKDPVPFAFLAMARRSWINFSVEMIAATDEQVQFTIAPQNFFIRLLVDPINLTYDATTRRLLRFEGITPIEKSQSGQAASGNIVARIEYEYF